MQYDAEIDERRTFSTLEDVMQRLATAKDKTFRELDRHGRIVSLGNKGSLGHIIEESVLGYDINSDAEPDIKVGEDWYELKVTPVKSINKGKQISAKERLVIDVINYMELAQEEDFEHSKMWDKARNIILTYYLDNRTDKASQPRIDCKVLDSFLMEYLPEDLAIIKHDWQVIHDKVAAGYADQLSESDTSYLSACTKGENSKQLRPAPAPAGSATPTIKAKQRAFSLKASYMTSIARHLLDVESRLEPLSLAPDDNLNKFIQSTFAPFKGLEAESIATALDMQVEPSAKQYNSRIAYAMLGTKSTSVQKIEQFDKAGVTGVKTITIYPNGKPREDMSFPAITDDQWRQWANPDATWEDSFLYDFFESNKFLFVVFQSSVPYKSGHDKSQDIFKNGFLWNMPEQDIDHYVKPVWEHVHRILESSASVQYGESGNNQLPGKAFNHVVHLRSHAQKGRNSGQESSITILPNGERITKQGVWLDREYIARIVQEYMK